MDCSGHVRAAPRSDRYINSPFHFNTLSSRKVMRIKKIISLGGGGGLLRYHLKFSGIANREMYGLQLGELAFRSWDERVKLYYVFCGSLMILLVCRHSIFQRVDNILHWIQITTSGLHGLFVCLFFLTRHG